VFSTSCTTSSFFGIGNMPAGKILRQQDIYQADGTAGDQLTQFMG